MSCRMDIESNLGQAVAGPPGVVRVHPLLLFNVADHATRFARLCRPQSNTDGVFGMVLGTETEGCIELKTSFEVNAKIGKSEGGCAAAIKVDHESLFSRIRQYRIVMPRNEILGFYVAPLTSLVSLDLEVPLAKALIEIIQKPLRFFLRFNVEALMSRNYTPNGKLPVSFFAIILENETKETLLSFRPFTPKQDVQITSSASEQIVVSTLSNQENGEISANIIGKKTFVCRESIKNRLEHILDWLTEVIEGRVPADHAILRDISGILWDMRGLTNDQMIERIQEDILSSGQSAFLATTTKLFTSSLAYRGSRGATSLADVDVPTSAAMFNELKTIKEINLDTVVDKSKAAFSEIKKENS